MNQNSLRLRRRFCRRAAIVIASMALLAVGCGDDDAGGGAPGEAAESTTSAAGAPTGDTAGGDIATNEGFCELALTVFEQEAMLTADQIAQLVALAPAEIAEAAGVIGEALIPAGDDLVAFFVAASDDGVEAALAETNAYEEAECGIPHSEQDAPLPTGASEEIEDGATRVDVTAIDYGFEVGEVSAGRTSFVLTNDGAEAHFMGISQLADGITIDDLLSSETGEGLTVGDWDTGLAGPGGADEEVITFDAEPGEYVLYCFIPGADGTPHVFSGMAIPLTIS